MKYKACWFFLLFLAAGSTIRAQQTLFFDKQEYSCAPSFNIAVRTMNITNTVALQGTVVWDTAVIKFSSISFGNAAISLNAGNINVAAVADGHLSFLWVENNLQGQSTPDNSSLFTINFITNGVGKGKGEIVFSNIPTALEIDTLDSNGLPVVNQGAVFTNGYIITPFIFRFTGSGNWDNAANWAGNVIPPGWLPGCSEIIIDPSGQKECILNVPQRILSGAKLTVATGKKLTVQGSLILQ